MHANQSFAFCTFRQKSNTIPEQSMLEDKHHRQLPEEQAEASDGCSHKFHMQDMQPRMPKKKKLIHKNIQSNHYNTNL